MSERAKLPRTLYRLRRGDDVPGFPRSKDATVYRIEQVAEKISAKPSQVKSWELAGPDAKTPTKARVAQLADLYGVDVEKLEVLAHARRVEQARERSRVEPDEPMTAYDRVNDRAWRRIHDDAEDALADEQYDREREERAS